jgi:hypothetical protein
MAIEDALSHVMIGLIVVMTDIVINRISLGISLVIGHGISLGISLAIGHGIALRINIILNTRIKPRRGRIGRENNTEKIVRIRNTKQNIVIVVAVIPVMAIVISTTNTC